MHDNVVRAGSHPKTLKHAVGAQERSFFPIDFGLPLGEIR